jgi:hypothetical protein
MGNAVCSSETTRVAQRQSPSLALLDLARDTTLLVLAYAVSDSADEFRRACVRGDRATAALAFEIVCRNGSEAVSELVHCARDHAVERGDVSLARWVTHTFSVPRRTMSRTDEIAGMRPSVPSPLSVLSKGACVQDVVCMIAQNTRCPDASHAFDTGNATHWCHRSVSDDDWNREEVRRVARSPDPRDRDVLLLCEWKTPAVFGAPRLRQLRVTSTHMLWETRVVALNDITHVETLDVDMVRILTGRNAVHDIEVPGRICILLTRLVSDLAAN